MDDQRRFEYCFDLVKVDQGVYFVESNQDSNLNGKLIALEKAKLLLTKEIEDMAARVDQANMLYGQAEKKIKMMDKTIGEWKSKANGLSNELNESQKD